MTEKLLRSILVSVLTTLVLVASVVGALRITSEEKVFQSDSLIFSAIGDPHYGWSSEQYADEIVDAWMADPNLPQVDFGINIGDFTHFGSPEGYKKAMEGSFNRMLFPWMFLFGNHDTANYKTGTGRDIYGDRWGLPDTDYYDKPYSAIEAGKNCTGVMGQNYAILWDNVLFLFFGDQGSTMLLTHEQRQWLEFMTGMYPDKTTITVSHQGFYTAERTDAYRYYNDLDWWKAFIESNPQIALHIHGHNHQFTHYQFFGLDAVDVGITNGNGKPWTVYFKVTEKSITAGIYDVLTREWIKPNFYRKELTTSFEEKGLEWYSVSKRVQDGQEFTEYNRILAEEYQIQMFG